MYNPDIICRHFLAKLQKIMPILYLVTRNIWNDFVAELVFTQKEARQSYSLSQKRGQEIHAIL